MLPIDLVLSRLDGAHHVPDGGWRACCPCAVHARRDPFKLSVDVGDDGRVLLHCFAGCSPEDVVAALGLRMTDLFPDDRARRRPKGPYLSADLLRLARREIGVAAVLMADLSKDGAFRPDAWSRLAEAGVRLDNIAKALYGKKRDDT